MRSIKGPTVIIPGVLSGPGNEFAFARKAYYLTQMRKYLVAYEGKMVKARAKYIAKQAATQTGPPLATNTATFSAQADAPN